MSLIMGQGFLFRVWVCMHLCYLYMKMHDVCENLHLFWLCGNKMICKETSANYIVNFGNSLGRG